MKEIRQVRYPGLVRHAHALGVSRNHLYLVLSGKRRSQRLLERYQALTGALPKGRNPWN